MTEEKVKLTVQLPRKLYNAALWYVEHTGFWCPGAEEESLAALTVYAIQDLLECEKNDPQLALERIQSELKTQLEA